MADQDKDRDEPASDGAFELEDDLLEEPEPKPPAEPEPDPEPEPAASPPPVPDLELELEDEAAPEPEPELEPQLEGEATDAKTVRMSLSDVVSAWDEEAPSDEAEDTGSSAGEPAKDRSSAKRMAIAVLVIVAVLTIIIVLFAGCAPAAYAAPLPEFAATTDPLALRPSDVPVAFEGQAPLVQQRRYRWRPWSLTIAPYGFLASVEGDVWADGDGSSISIPFEEIIDRTNAGGMVHMHFGYKRWFFEADGLFAKIGDDLSLGKTDIEVRITQYQVELGVGYRLLGPSFGRWVGCDGLPARCPQQAVDLYAGMRYARTESTIHIRRPGGIILPAVGTKATDTQDYWEPYLGVAWRRPLTKKWLLRFRGDIGGFGVNEDASNFSWRLEALAGWKLSERIAFFFGWRLFNQDRVRGDGPARTGTDLLQHGPMIGAVFAL